MREGERGERGQLSTSTALRVLIDSTVVHLHASMPDGSRSAVIHAVHAEEEREGKVSETIAALSRTTSTSSWLKHINILVSYTVVVKWSNGVDF